MFKTFYKWTQTFYNNKAFSACAYPHTSRGSSVKLAIGIGLAAKLPRMRSKATKDDFAIRNC